MKLREFRLIELPPEEHAIGIYLGLALGSFVLGVGSIVLFRDLLRTFQTEGLNITLIFVFRFFLMMISAYASLASIFGLFRMIGLQRMLVRKVDKEFRDFVMYARPLVEEIIRQRIIGEKIAEKLEKFSRIGRMEGEKLRTEGGRVGAAGFPKWGEFLLFVALLGNISVGLFLYSIDFPWQLVPYSVILLGIMWWFVVAKYFGLLFDIRSYYLPAIFILVMPSLSIILRAYILPYQTVYVVFFLMFFYIVGMYVHYNYLATERFPEFIVVGPTKFKEIRAALTREVDKSVPAKLRGYLPEKPVAAEEGQARGSKLKEILAAAKGRLKR